MSRTACLLLLIGNKPIRFNQSSQAEALCPSFTSSYTPLDHERLVSAEGTPRSHSIFTSATRLPRLLEPAPLQDLSPNRPNNDSADGNHHPLFRCTHTSSRPYLCPRNIRRNPHHVVPMFLRVPLPVRDEQPPHQHSPSRPHNSAAQVVHPHNQTRRSRRLLRPVLQLTPLRMRPPIRS